VADRSGEPGVGAAGEADSGVAGEGGDGATGEAESTGGQEVLVGGDWRVVGRAVAGGRWPGGGARVGGGPGGLGGSRRLGAGGCGGRSEADRVGIPEWMPASVRGRSASGDGFSVAGTLQTPEK
jgi:hypothetical protein